MKQPQEYIPSFPEPLVIVISGLSAGGKDSVIRLMKQRNLPFHFVITATSRLPRPEEKNGVDYFFVSKEHFERMIQQGELIEYALVYEQYKGVPRTQVEQALESGKDVVLRLDVQGAAKIRELWPNAILIFVSVSEEEMVSRLKKRQTETDDQLALRIAASRREMEQIPMFDYLVINREAHLEECVETVLAIIRAEHHRVRPRK